ncbi:MAG: lysophospholipid acyltransferase family protein [Acidobacteria bacterium]|nr:lysophospholipid acyltransferase family protein [Acidobacteriota bacterium]
MWRYKLAGSVLGQVLRVWKWTVRLEYRGIDILEEHPRAVLAMWHGRLLSGAFGGGKFCVASMASQSPDGEVAARAFEAMNVRIVRGSSTRGGQKALLRLFKMVESGEVCRAGLTVDGPKGPAREVKLGIVTLARRFGVPILPASFSSRPYWMLRSWDRMVLAPPFSRMILGVGSPVMVADDLSDKEVALQVGQAIDRLTDELDRELHGRPLWEDRSELR